MKIQPECAVSVQLWPADSCGSDFSSLMIMTQNVRLTMKVMRWRSQSDSVSGLVRLYVALYICSTHLFTFQLLSSWSGKVFCFFLCFLFFHHALQTNGIANFWHLFYKFLSPNLTSHSPLKDHKGGVTCFKPLTTNHVYCYLLQPISKAYYTLYSVKSRNQFY